MGDGSLLDEYCCEEVCVVRVVGEVVKEMMERRRQRLRRTTSAKHRQ